MAYNFTNCVCAPCMLAPNTAMNGAIASGVTMFIVLPSATPPAPMNKPVPVTVSGYSSGTAYFRTLTNAGSSQPLQGANPFSIGVGSTPVNVQIPASTIVLAVSACYIDGGGLTQTYTSCSVSLTPDGNISTLTFSGATGGENGGNQVVVTLDATNGLWEKQ